MASEKGGGSGGDVIRGVELEVAIRSCCPEVEHVSKRTPGLSWGDSTPWGGITGFNQSELRQIGTLVTTLTHASRRN